MISGYTGPGHKTIVPSEAKVRIDFRLLPNMNPQKCIKKLKNHLIEHGFGHLEVKAFDAAEPPYKISVKEDISQAIIKAAEEVFGEKPVVNGVSAEGYLSKPGNLDSKAPGIVVIQEWWGLDDHIKSITERFAEQGFIALAPDLFHGSVTTEPDEAM